MDQLAILVLWLFFASFLSIGVWSGISLSHNIRLARMTGLPCKIVPYSMLGAPWQLAQFIVVPVAKQLPDTVTQNWLPLLLFHEFWHNGYEPFERLKADTFLAVSPGGLILHTCDPDVVVQILHDTKFGKPAELMSILNIFGPTITGTDGLESRLYRRITRPFFSENTLRRVFDHSVSSSKRFLDALLVPNAHLPLRILFARLSLSILKHICFTRQNDADLINTLASKEKIPAGKTLGYCESLHGLMEHFGTVFLIPHWVLRLSPLESHRYAARCYSELASYMDQTKRAREKAMAASSVHKTSSVTDLLDLLIQANKPSTKQAKPLLTDNQVIGQIFLFMFAGHEANANIVVSIILLLACHPQVQSAMQRDLDRLLGHTCPSTWSYDEQYNALMCTTVGAVINEALRLFTVIPVLPKAVPLNGPWLGLNVKGQRHPLPPSTIILANTSATHRHPKYWPKRPADESQSKFPWDHVTNDRRQRPYAVADFDPFRWLESANMTKPGPEKFMKPLAGTFIPFSEGSRGCLGRRFALAEVCGVVSALFKTHSVKLVVEPFDGLLGGENAWLEARRLAALALSEGTKFDMSLRLSRTVPIRFVPRDVEEDY